MPALSPDEVEAFLGEREHLVRIATVDATGAPHVVPAWFLYREGRILMTPRERSSWWGHVQREPRVALTVDEGEPPYRKVVVRGAAEVLNQPGDDDAWRDVYRQLTCRYVSEQAADAYLTSTWQEPRALLAVPCDPAAVTTWRMPLAGEDPRGIWAARYYHG